MLGVVNARTGCSDSGEACTLPETLIEVLEMEVNLENLRPVYFSIPVHCPKRHT